MAGGVAQETQAQLTDARAEVLRLRRLVADLIHPDPLRYWRDLGFAAAAAWTAFVLLCVYSSSPWALAVLYPAAVLLWYRASVFVHELAHLRPSQVPGFRTAWNFAVGAPLLLPSIMYEGVHAGHHRKATYGTIDDPEYLLLAGRPATILAFVLAGLVLPLLLALRFLALVPASFAAPPFRHWLLRNGSAFTMNPRYVRELSSREIDSLRKWDVGCTIWAWGFVATIVAGWLPWTAALWWYAVYAGVCTLNHLRTLVAHRYESEGRATDHAGQLADSVDTPEPWWTALWAPLGLRFHALHHLLPNLPYHRLPAAYARIRAASAATDFYRRSEGAGLWRSLRQLWSKRAGESRA